MDATTAYFLKKYYPHVIKWWLVSYNPEVVRVWPTKAERKEAERKEALKKEKLALEQKEKEQENASAYKPQAVGQSPDSGLDDSAYNATTGSYSGLYGKGPVDDQTKEALNAILSISNNQNTVDSLLLGNDADEPESLKKKENHYVGLPPEQDDIVKEANAIYERLLREAAEDEAKKQAEIEAVRRQVEQEQET